MGARSLSSIALISDVHGNLPALEAVLADVRGQGVNETYCLGDLVGYGGDPNGVVDLIRTTGIPTIMGNYDDGVGFERGHCGCFYPDAEAQRLGTASYEFTSRVVTEENKAFLRSLPRELRRDFDGRHVHLVHGSPRRINEYLLPTRDRRTFERIAAVESADVLVFGHTHQAWHEAFARVLFVNVGSAGRPKDGDPRASYTIMHFGTRAQAPVSEAKSAAADVAADLAGQLVLEVVEMRVSYDVELAASEVLSVGLPAELAEVLRRGG